MRRILFLLIFGLGGAAILISLGVWQVQRLAWKQDILARIDARIADAPMPLPQDPDPETDEYRPVTVSGAALEGAQTVLVSVKGQGAGYRIVGPFATDDGRRILVDYGFVPVTVTELEGLDKPAGPMTVIGNLLWPDEIDQFTPAPDFAQSLWFARDLPLLAVRLETEPVLIVAADVSVPTRGVTPLPVDGAAIPNDHLQYAITWFSLAAIWVVMTLYLLRRTGREADKGDTG